MEGGQAEYARRTDGWTQHVGNTTEQGPRNRLIRWVI